MRKLLIYICSLILLGLVTWALRRGGPGEVDGKVKLGSVFRRYVLYVPKSYNPNTPTPLVISLHGFMSWPENQMYISRWNKLADQEGFLVVYPSGTRFPKRWDTGGLTGAESHPEQEVLFLSRMIDQLSAGYNLDPQRIYANGMSNGGGMAYLLACALSDRIAAVGMVAGAFVEPEGGCKPARPLPVIAFHGTADPIVPYYGGVSSPRHRPFAPVSSWAAAWAERNGCGMIPEQLPGVGDANAIRYDSCQDGAEVVFYTIDGGGHSWPGGGYLPATIVGHTSMAVSATEIMWEFFTRHPLVK